MEPVRVLFVCTGNSARSIIAEALLREIGGEEFEVSSAGTAPKGIHPLTEIVLREAGLEREGLESKPVSLFLDEDFDYVITVCDTAAEVCPVFPGASERIHWSFPDPAGSEGDDLARLTAFQTTMREMRQRIAMFAAAAGPVSRGASRRTNTQ